MSILESPEARLEDIDFCSLPYVECPYCHTKTYQVWDQESVNRWWKKHLKECEEYNGNR